MLLKVGHREIIDGEPFPERPGEVLEVKLDALQRGFFEAAVPVSVEVSVAEGGKGQRALLQRFLGWVAIKLQKCDNIHSGRQMQ